MKASTRSRDTGASFAARRGHAQQLSISDEDHHVTEAIGHMYGDEPEQQVRKTPGRSGQNGVYIRSNSPRDNGPEQGEILPRKPSIPRKEIPERDAVNGNAIGYANGQPKPVLGRLTTWDDEGTPIMAHNSHNLHSPHSPQEGRLSDTAVQPFPLNDIDYESSPAAVAQELSNLQALRRMSMDVGAAGDPDLPQLNAAGMPSPPSATSSEDDASRLFWVPARLHPELAPKEFRTFLESKAEQIKRRSGELSQFTTPGSSRSSSLSTQESSSLRRKKSMLSRQINSSVGYQDGAERLEHKKSQSQKSSPVDPNLEELESLVSNNTQLQRLSLEGSDEGGDIILPSAPGSSLKRSTRTTYRRGGSVKGKADRGTYAQRAARRAAAGSTDSAPPVPSTPEVTHLPTFGILETSNLAQTLKDPSTSPPSVRAAHNFSRPVGRSSSPPSADLSSSIPTTFDNILGEDEIENRLSTSSMPEMRRPSPGSKRTAITNIPPEQQQIPQIVEIPPPEEPSIQGRPLSMPVKSSQPVRHPERSSSREDWAKAQPQRPSMPPKQHSSIGSVRPPSRGNAIPLPSKPVQALEQPSPLPGNDTNTSNLSFIPTLTVDKRADNKKKEDSKKSSWGWLLGKEDGEKEKLEKNKGKISKSPQQHDNTRLDVLQTSIDGGGKGRESFVLDRDNLKLEEERKKESQRKSTGAEPKREKEGLFSSIFGGKKSKGEKDSMSKKKSDRGLSPEPPYREMRPDIDYNWTRFSILEERAIYRMAHMKLANPRRALYSQVLLSNFMYSYLAKVQQMHPQMNLPTSAKQQKKQQQQQQQQKDPQPEEFAQYQRYQQQQAQQQLQNQQQQPQQYSQQGAHQNYSSQQDYEKDSARYGYDSSNHRPNARGNVSAIEHNDQSYEGGYNQYHHNNNNRQPDPYCSHDDEGDDDMW